MRQFVFGLLVAVFAWWGWSALAGEPEADGNQQRAVPGDGAPPGGVAAPIDIGQMLGSPQVAPAATNAALDARSEPVTAAASAATDELLGRVGTREPTAVAAAWSMLARSRSAAERERLTAALTPLRSEFADLLASLGPTNSFLHTAEGRAIAGKALTAVMAMPDNDAVLAGSQLISLALRGRIERPDTEARAFVDEIYKQHRVRVDRWLCDPANVARARSYTVAKGDSLARIASRFRRDGVLVEDGTIAVLNRIHNPNQLQVGQKIKVPVDPIVAVLEKRSYSLAVYVGDFLMRLYWVGHGENDKTPVTEFVVSEKQPRPDWTAPDGNRYPYGHPKNILGEYFIKFRHERYTGFGAHGTPMPETICTMSSMGCIRMLAPDIAELFQILPRGTKVIVRCTESLT